MLCILIAKHSVWSIRSIPFVGK